MVIIKYRKNNSILLSAFGLLFLYIIKVFIAKGFSWTNAISLPAILFLFGIHFYIRWSYYLMITKDRIVKNNFIYKEKIVLNEIIEKRIIGAKYVLKTSSKTFRININFMNNNSFKELYNELDKLDL